MKSNEYTALEKKLNWKHLPTETIQQQIAQMNAKDAAYIQLNKAWDSLPHKEQKALVGCHKPGCGECKNPPNVKALQGEWSRHNDQEKKAHSKDILQPLNKDGQINKHFVEAHGTRSIEKEMKIPAKVIRENIERYG